MCSAILASNCKSAFIKPNFYIVLCKYIASINTKSKQKWSILFVKNIMIIISTLCLLSVEFSELFIYLYQYCLNCKIAFTYLLFVGGSDSKESACSAEDPGSIPGLGRSPEKGNSYPLQYSCLENSMDKGAGRLPGPADKENKSRSQWHGSLRKKPMVKNGVERAECSLNKSAILLSKTATFILVQAENIVHKKCHLVFVTSIQFFVLSDCRGLHLVFGILR